MTQGELAICGLLDDAGVEIDSGTWAAVQVLLAKPDLGCDPTYAVDGLGALVELIVAFTDRLGASWPVLSEGQRERTAQSLRYAGSLLNGFDNDNKNEAT
ncbi:MAG: hypothetical protein Q8N48_06940 [Thiobacillus sp.]|nr:hypothetical protein [Thiobacillus sp.]MDP2978548.1 hypothetical protein [Thiobacillus sp.]